MKTLPDSLRNDPLWKSAYYRLSIGELGETQGWYFRSRHILGSEVLDKRIEVIQKTIALTVTAINQNRRKP